MPKKPNCKTGYFYYLCKKKADRKEGNGPSCAKGEKSTGLARSEEGERQLLAKKEGGRGKGEMTFTGGGNTQECSLVTQVKSHVALGRKGRRTGGEKSTSETPTARYSRAQRARFNRGDKPAHKLERKKGRDWGGGTLCSARKGAKTEKRELTPERKGRRLCREKKKKGGEEGGDEKTELQGGT